MANTRFEFVKHFERENLILQNCWFVVRVDGHSFSEFSTAYEFEKPNDVRSLNLMTKCAKAVMAAFGGEICLAYGQSDEYSFVFRRSTQLWARREAKIVSNVVSLFTSGFVFHWNEFFPTKPLTTLPSFDARVVCYPTDRDLCDYLAWRQADCHINNQYNSTFWCLVKSGKTNQEAAEMLKGTQTPEKNELMFSKGINYNEIPPIFRKGTILIKEPPIRRPSPRQAERKQKQKTAAAEDTGTDADASPTVVDSPKGSDLDSDAAGGSGFPEAALPAAEEEVIVPAGGRKIGAAREVVELHEDLIEDAFWDRHSHILAPSKKRKGRKSINKKRSFGGNRNGKGADAATETTGEIAVEATTATAENKAPS